MLDLEDLHQAVLVCRKWRQVGENPRLWKRNGFGHLEILVESNLEFLDMRRMQHVEELILDAEVELGRSDLKLLIKSVKKTGPVEISGHSKKQPLQFQTRKAC